MALSLARWQFGITSTYHFFFVPLTLGLSVLLAILETFYVRTGNERYKQMVQFWGKLFLINFALGVATGIVMEFQFGMNWSEYSRFVGDIFGAPLAIEALLAFFLESTFLGIWIFGWDKLSKKAHLTTIWLVAIGSSLSALWILAANSWMQEPVGYVLRNGRAEMVDFLAILGNKHLWVQFPHVFFGGITTAAFFVMGISAYHLWKKSPHRTIFQQSFRFAVVYGVIGIILTILNGHAQGQHLVENQPMKLAAAEALWENENPASMSLFTVGDEVELRDRIAIKIPYMLSILAYNRPSGEVRGIKNIQKEYENTYGPGDYIPSVIVSYWSFRIMVGLGLAMLVLTLYYLIRILKERLDFHPRWLKFSILMIFAPYLANTAGWTFAEMGRQPWIVFGLMKTEDAVSKAVSTGEVVFTLIMFTLIYAVLIVADVYLLKKYAVAGIPDDSGKEG